MTTILARRSSTLDSTPSLPPLYNGDRLTQAEFHRRYKAYPDNVKVELIAGIVCLASPLRRSHGTYHAELSAAFWLYKNATPGVELLDNATGTAAVLLKSRVAGQGQCCGGNRHAHRRVSSVSGVHPDAGSSMFIGASISR